MTRQKPLDRVAVVQAAADLLNREGVEALTLSHLSRILKIQTPSLYNHIHSMADLLHELAIVNMRQLAVRLGSVAIGQSGPEGLLAVAQGYRNYIKENPGLYMLSLRASGNLVEHDIELQICEEKVVNIVLVMLGSLGLQGEAAIHAARGLRSAIHGFATLEIMGGFGLPFDLDESFLRLIGNLIIGLRSYKV